MQIEEKRDGSSATWQCYADAKPIRSYMDAVLSANKIRRVRVIEKPDVHVYTYSTVCRT